MIEKLPPLSLAEGFKIWAEEMDVGDKQHLSSLTIKEMAQPGALDGADEDHLEHLALCPECVKKWVVACNEVVFTEDDAADDWYSGGMLEAAATERSGSPITLPSKCGNFEIRLLPDRDSATKYMAVLEVISPRKSEFENSHITINDCEGKLLLEGTVRGARIGRRVEDLDDFDLSSWSMIVRFSRGPGRDAK